MHNPTANLICEHQPNCNKPSFFKKCSSTISSVTFSNILPVLSFKTNVSQQIAIIFCPQKLRLCNPLILYQLIHLPHQRFLSTYKSFPMKLSLASLTFSSKFEISSIACALSFFIT